MSKKELTNSYAIYDYYGEDKKHSHGIVKFNFQENTYEWIKKDNNEGNKYFYLKALTGLRKMYKRGTFTDTCIVAVG